MGSSDAEYLMVSRRKFIEEEDYDTLTKWWQKHGNEQAPPSHYLSDTGIVIEVNHEPAAMIFMYHTNSAICIAEFFTVNPDTSKETRNEALDYLIQCTIEWAQKANYSMIYVSTNIKKYINRLRNRNFIEADTNMTHCFYEVKYE